MEHTPLVRAISFLALLVALGWLIFEPGPEPVITALLGIAGLLSTRKRFDASEEIEESRGGVLEPAPARPSDRKSLAVLPLRSIGEDPANEFFSDGLTEDIIAHLAHVDDLRVISRTSAMRFKESQATVREIASALGVGTVLEGSVRRAGERLRVVVKLIDAPNDAQLWAETYDRELADVFAIQSEIALAVVDALRASLDPSDEARIRKPPTRSTDAHDLYLLGRHHWWSFTADGLTRAQQYFEDALTADPEYAPAHAGLAYMYLVAGPGGGERFPWSFSMPKAKEGAARAAQLDPQNGEALGTLSLVHAWFEWDWDQALNMGRLAVEAEPSSSIAWGCYAHVLAMVGQREESIQAGQTFVALDPLAALAHMNLGQHLFNARRPEEAIPSLERCLSLEPGFYWATTLLSDISVWSGDPAAAAERLRTVTGAAEQSGYISASLGAALGAAGDMDGFAEVSGRLDAWAAEGRESWAAAAVPHIWVGDRERAIQCVQRVPDQQPVPSGWPSYLGVFPMYDPLREDPRFRAVVEEVGLLR